jgi:putative copper export protein/mono/diheme cytochrome c family protein
MTPAFDLQGGLPLALARAGWVACLLSTFGALVFQVVVMPRVIPTLAEPDARRIRRRLLRLTQASAALGLVWGLAWLGVQSWTMAGAASLAQLISAVPVVAAHTQFGHLIVPQLAALILVLLILKRPWALLAGASAALALQAGHSHAASMYTGPSLLLAADIVHLAAAGAWLGGLLPLLLVVQTAPPRIGATAARWFSPLGQICVAALAVSASYQFWVLVGTLPGLLGTAYGWLILIKLALFAILLGFAWVNRYRFAPALLNQNPEPAKTTLIRSIAVQSCAGLAVVAAAAVLSNLPPAMHLQPLWPFPERFTLDTVREDTGFRTEALAATLVLTVALALALTALLWRHRLRWFAAAAASVLAWLAIPHLDLLVVPANPTSFYHSPTRFAADAILDGATLYPANCAACHGANGHGDGPAAATLPVPPADLTAAHLWMHSDGDLFWWLSHGMTAPDGAQAMPGFAASLTEDQRWDLIDFIRARNAGLAFAATGAWPVPLAAPEVQASCASGKTVALSDLRGQVVRVIIGAPPPDSPITSFVLGAPAGIQPSGHTCTVDDAAAPAAYALVAGVPLSTLPGTQFLVDGDGWLRAVQPSGTAPSWNDPHALASAIAQLKTQKLTKPEDDAMPMNMKM